MSGVGGAKWPERWSLCLLISCFFVCVSRDKTEGAEEGEGEEGGAEQEVKVSTEV